MDNDYRYFSGSGVTTLCGSSPPGSLLLGFAGQSLNTRLFVLGPHARVLRFEENQGWYPNWSAALEFERAMNQSTPAYRAQVSAHHSDDRPTDKAPQSRDVDNDARPETDRQVGYVVTSLFQPPGNSGGRFVDCAISRS